VDNSFKKLSTFFVEMEDLLIKELLINDQIRFGGEVRLVGENGEQLGIVSVLEAKKIATQKSLDLALISPNATPPVCKVMNYGKYRYEVQKKEKEARSKQKIVETKTIRFGLNIGEHDVEYRAKQAKEFLAKGNKVKANMRLSGRENAYAQKGIETLQHFADIMSEWSVIEVAPFKEGRYINMIIAPKK
jgi:translation initiation factor IF-3